MPRDDNLVAGAPFKSVENTVLRIKIVNAGRVLQET